MEDSAWSLLDAAVEEAFALSKRTLENGEKWELSQCNPEVSADLELYEDAIIGNAWACLENRRRGRRTDGGLAWASDAARTAEEHFGISMDTVVADYAERFPVVLETVLRTRELAGLVHRLEQASEASVA